MAKRKGPSSAVETGGCVRNALPMHSVHTRIHTICPSLTMALISRGEFEVSWGILAQMIAVGWRGTVLYCTVQTVDACTL